MAGAAASESILFIGAILAAAGLAGALSAAAGSYSQGLQERSSSLGAQMTERIAIVNDPDNVPTGPLRLYVKNIGPREVTVASLSVLVDGVASASWTATVGGAAATKVSPGQLATITVTDLAPGAGDHRATVVTAGGYAAVLDFNV